MRARSFRPRLESLDERIVPSLVPGGTYPVDGPHVVRTADFNNDGHLDLATTTWSGFPGVSVILGAGDGTFGNARLLSSAAQMFAVGDFNGDGNADLATAYSDYVGDGPYPPYYSAYSQVEVFSGRGDGSFDPARTVLVSNELEMLIGELRVADVNDDGRSDLGLWNGGLVIESIPYGVVSLLGNADGSFTQTGEYDYRAYLRSPPAPDFNGDGYGDSIATDGNAVSVRLGRPDATDSPALVFQTGSYVTGYAVGDFNGDGRPDVATANPYSGSGSVSVLLNDGNWPPADAPTIRVGDAAVTEGNTGTRTATFTVTLSSASGVPVTVDWATAAGTATAGDYLAAGGTLTFAPGETTKIINVVVTGDRLAEPNENFVVNLGNATNATNADGVGVGTIVDDEPRVSIGDVTRKEGNGKKTTVFTFTVSLSVPYDQPVTVSYRTTDGTAATGDGDYLGRTGTLTFAPGETTKTVTIEVKSDNKKETDETFYLDLFDNSVHSWFAKSRGTGAVLNDD